MVLPALDEAAEERYLFGSGTMSINALILYVNKNIHRRIHVYLILCLFIAALLAAWSLFVRAIDQKRQDIQDAYETIPVYIVLSNIAGTRTDGLEIPDYWVEYFISESYSYQGYEQDRAFSSYVENVQIKTTLYYKLNLSGAEPAGGALPVNQKLIGITGMSAAGAGEALSAKVDFLPGYDESFLGSDEHVCIVSEKTAAMMNEDNSIHLAIQASPVGDKALALSLNVIGIHHSDDDFIYCPWQLAVDCQTALEGHYTADSLRATVRDNTELSEFCQILSRHFCAVTPSGKAPEMHDSPVLTHYAYAAIIQDEELNRSLQDLNKSLRMLELIRTPLLIVVILLGACMGALFVHSQEGDLKTARMLGTSTIQILSILGIELLGWLPLGLLLGMGLVSAAWKINVQILVAIGIGISTLLGSIVCCLTQIDGKRGAFI